VKKLFLINGVFFQNIGGPSPFTFFGVIKTDGDAGDGEMRDNFGTAIITDVVLTAEELCFTKRYAHRTDQIKYRFRHHAGMWVGSYQGRETGEDEARCILTEVPETFFQPSAPR
jgi:hypothetical protein